MMWAWAVAARAACRKRATNSESPAPIASEEDKSLTAQCNTAGVEKPGKWPGPATSAMEDADVTQR
eukprot:9113357-Lingulodinium_polyedra.AAC.1